MSKKILVSGIQSSGKLHIGNYFGAIKQNVALGNSGDYESYVFIADYHSMTSLTNATERREHTFDAACTYLACGLDPSKVALFKQSDIPVHTELSWILNTVTPMPMLMLAHSFKDGEAKNKDINAGLFTYPVLMAADILMYQGEVIPVGKDQEQHIEMAREIAGKFNRAYSEVFTMPKAYVIKEVATVPGTDGTKMSKSKGNTIPLFGTDEEIKKVVMSIVTDSARPEDVKNPDESAIYQIHKLFLNEEENELLRKRFTDGGYGYKEAKETCAEVISNFVRPMREKYDYYQSHKDEVLSILNDGAVRARAKSDETMKVVRDVVGLSF